MPISAYNKFDCFAQDSFRGVHNLDSDALKIALTNVAPVRTQAVLADITEIAAGNGYPAGGEVVDVISYDQTTGVGRLLANDRVFTAVGGDVGPFRYAVFYNSTPASKPLIAWYDYGANRTLQSGETFTVSYDAILGVLTLE